MRYPDFLKPGGRIGYIAPSFGCTQEPYRTLFTRSLKKLAAAGYENVLGPNCFASDGVGKSTSPQACGAEINDFFLHDRSDVIISCGGGETMCEDLPFVDFAGIAAARPKWFLGYSDNTNLILTLPTLCDTAAMYGPNACVFGTEPEDPQAALALRLLSGDELRVESFPFWESAEGGALADPLGPADCREPSCIRAFLGSVEQSSLQVSGRLLGGCLDCLELLRGTPFDGVRSFNRRYAADGTLWFIEACDLNPMSIRRSLWSLKQAGWFDTATGFLFGRPLHLGENYLGVDCESAVLDILGELELPILLNLDIGHLAPQFPVLAGSVGHAGFENGRFRMRYELH